MDNKLDLNRIFNYKCPKRSKKFRDNLIEYKGEKYKSTIDFAYPITTNLNNDDILF